MTDLVSDPTSDQGLTQSLPGLPRFAKQVLAVGLDVVLCAGSLWLALALRLDTLIRLPSQHSPHRLLSRLRLLSRFSGSWGFTERCFDIRGAERFGLWPRPLAFMAAYLPW